MNPAYECPLDTPLDEMKKYIEEYRRPALIIGENGVLLAKNRFADYKVFKVRLGCSAKKLLPSWSFRLFTDLKPGEIKRVRLQTGRHVSAAAAGFWGYTLVFCLSAREETARNVLELNRIVGREALGLLGLCRGLSPSDKGDMLMLKQLTAEQLRREINLGKMIEILTGTGEEAGMLFSPFLLAGKVCGIAEKLAGEGGPALVSRLSPTELCGRGPAADYCSALAAMVAFALSHAVGGRVRVDGEAADRVYKVGVSFAGDIPCRKLERLLFCRHKTLDEPFILADLLYIRCIAEDSLWSFDIVDGRSAKAAAVRRAVGGEGRLGEGGAVSGGSGEGRLREGGAVSGGSGEVTLKLSVPVFAESILRQPLPGTLLSRAVRAQLSSLSRRLT